MSAGKILRAQPLCKNFSGLPSRTSSSCVHRSFLARAAWAAFLAARSGSSPAFWASSRAWCQAFDTSFRETPVSFAASFFVYCIFGGGDGGLFIFGGGDGGFVMGGFTGVFVAGVLMALTTCFTTFANAGPAAEAMCTRSHARISRDSGNIAKDYRFGEHLGTTRASLNRRLPRRASRQKLLCLPPVAIMFYVVLVLNSTQLHWLKDLQGDVC